MGWLSELLVPVKRIEPGGMIRMFTQAESSELHQLMRQIDALYAKVGVKVTVSITISKRITPTEAVP